MRRIAFYSDIHGNAPALEAVYADIDSHGVAERYCLGDLIGYGPDPERVVQLVRESGDPTVSGNYDVGVASRSGGCGCYYATEQARADGERSYEFTEAALDEESAQWLLSREPQITLAEGGARILLVHGSPRKNNEYLLLDRSEQQLARLAEEASADVVCHGHIHVPYHRSFSAAEGADDAGSQGTVHYVSSGSVGKPRDGDLRACWVEIVLGSEVAVRAAAPDDSACASVGETDVWLGVREHRVAYDIDSVASAMIDAGLPVALAEALRRA